MLKRLDVGRVDTLAVLLQRLDPAGVRNLSLELIAGGVVDDGTARRPQALVAHDEPEA